MMNSSTKIRWRWALRATAALVSAAQLVMPTTSVAQTASAGSIISSQASATYYSSDGKLQPPIQSNEVSTTVQQVGAFNVVTEGNKSAGAGGSVAVTHSITNTGNGSDSFTIEVRDNPAELNEFVSIDVFADINADGQADNSTSLLVGGPALAGMTRTSQAITIAEKQSYSYVVVYSVPPSATMPWMNSGLVKVTATNTGIGYAQQSQEQKDTINLTTAAAFNVRLTHGAPAVAAAGGGSWGATPSSGERGTVTTYTLTSGAIDNVKSVEVEADASMRFKRSNSYTFAKVISGAGKVEQAGASLNLTGANTYTGPTVITSGALRPSDGAIDGSINFTSGVQIASGAELRFDYTTDVIFDRSITGEGKVLKHGPKVLTLSGNSSTFTGPIEIHGGTLAVAHKDALGDAVGKTTILRGATLDLKGVDVSEPVTATVTGTGTVELAMYVFGDLLTAEAWMHERNVFFAATPAQVCERPGGLDAVLRLLYAIANGTEP
jgi:autotransporter-associated beta strand protein